ncbi:MAG: amidase [Pseudomonadota bacterium]
MSKTISRRDFTLGTLAAVGGLAAARAAEPQSDLTQLYSEADALTLAEHVRAGDVSPAELLEEAIARTERVNPKINAVTTQHFELARAYVREQPLPSGPFRGVPFLLKDLGARLAGTVTTGGSRLLKGIEAPQDDVLTQRYKQAGLVIFGKTNTPEFGMALTTEPYLFGPCRNPWNLKHSTAGSSGGAAAAVAAGIVPMANATDGGGSIRVPAAACGLFGLKPTRALTPRAVGPSMMSVSHVISRSVRDSAAALDVTAGYAPGLPFVSPEPVGGYRLAVSQAPEPLRVALVTDEPELRLDPGVAAAIDKVAKKLEELGHRVEEAAPGVDFDRLNQAQNTMILAEFSQGMQSLASAIGRPLDASTLERLSLEFVEVGAATSATEYVAAWEHVQSVTRSLAGFFERYDLMLSPVTVTPPPKLGVINEQPEDNYQEFVDRFRTYSAYTPLQNLTGMPAASLPVGLSKDGLPVAAMISAGLGHDARILAVSAQLEQALPFERRRPPVYAG